MTVKAFLCRTHSRSFIRNFWTSLALNLIESKTVNPRRTIAWRKLRFFAFKKRSSGTVLSLLTCKRVNKQVEESLTMKQKTTLKKALKATLALKNYCVLVSPWLIKAFPGPGTEEKRVRSWKPLKKLWENFQKQNIYLNRTRVSQKLWHVLFWRIVSDLSQNLNGKVFIWTTECTFPQLKCIVAHQVWLKVTITIRVLSISYKVMFSMRLGQWVYSYVSRNTIYSKKVKVFKLKVWRACSLTEWYLLLFFNFACSHSAQQRVLNINEDLEI